MARARPIHGLKPEATVRANAQKIVATRTAEFFSFAPYLANETYVTQLHDMRIAAKRLRYALELFKDALDPDAAGCLAIVKEFQEIVGDIHDHDVLVDILRDHLQTISAERARALAELAVQSDDAIEALKERLRASVTDEAWVAEQAAIAAAIARTTRERHERYNDLVKQWSTWRAAGLRERLEALTVDLPDDLTGGKRHRRHSPAPGASPEPAGEPAEDAPGAAGTSNGAKHRQRASGKLVTGMIRRTIKVVPGLLLLGCMLLLRGGGGPRTSPRMDRQAGDRSNRKDAEGREIAEKDRGSRIFSAPSVLSIFLACSLSGFEMGVRGHRAAHQAGVRQRWSPTSFGSRQTPPMRARRRVASSRSQS